MSQPSRMVIVWDVFHLIPESAEVAAVWCESCGDVPKIAEDEEVGRHIHHACENPRIRIDYV